MDRAMTGAKRALKLGRTMARIGSGSVPHVIRLEKSPHHTNTGKAVRGIQKESYLKGCHRSSSDTEVN